jgi:hypothetical protein
MCIRVEFPDDGYTLVPEPDQEGADADWSYVDKNQDPDTLQTNCACEGKPRSIT